MPLHDWTRVTAGTFHSFHLGWIAEITRALNGGVLPKDLYALAEQRAGEFEPDLLTLEQHDDPQDAPDGQENDASGGTAVAMAKPRARMVGAVNDASLYALKRRTVTIRHATDDRIVALLEITSPGNKDRSHSVTRFVDKAIAALQSGYHLVVIDPLPPRTHDPAGLTNSVWEAIGGEAIKWPGGEGGSITSFRVAATVECYGEPLAVGQAIPEMPLFYDPDWYVNLPLEATYSAAYEGVPRRWREVIEK